MWEKMSSKEGEAEECEELSEGGDLGLGRGLKPGGIPNDEDLVSDDNFTTVVKTRPRSPSASLPPERYI